MSNRNAALAEKLITTPAALRIVAFDTETTGMWAASHQIVELGAVLMTGDGSIVKEYQSLVNPGRPIPPEVIPVHGITDLMVAQAPRMNIVLSQFLEFALGADFLIAHNAPFDLGFLRWEAKRIGFNLPDIPVLDSCALARRLLPGHASYSLENLSRALGFVDKQEHRALGDARLVAMLTHALLQAAGAVPSEQLPKLLQAESLGAALDEAPLPERLWLLNEAVRQSITVWITYESTTVAWHSRRVEPRHLFGHNGKGYLTAFCHWTGSERTFRLDRITAVNSSPVSV